MRYVRVAVLSAALGVLVAGSAALAQGLPPLVLDESADATTVTAFVGQAILVNLQGNLTTGYTWVLTNTTGGSVVTNGPRSYVPDPGGGVGVGGTFSFPFLAVVTGDTTLGFEYRPPGGGPAPQTFRVTIGVAPAPPRLSISIINADVFLSWPMAGSTNFFLEGTTRLAPPQWVALNALPLPDGTNYTVNLGRGTNPLYFRLRHAGNP